jgi:hypothetical protein
MTTVKSINLYTRPERIQKERYGKSLGRTGKKPVSAEQISQNTALNSSAEKQLELPFDE